MREPSVERAEKFETEWERAEDMGRKVRGCGTRSENALYVCVGTSPYGRPIESFLIDPPKPWDGPQLRSPMLYYAESLQAYQLVMGIGKKYYPFVPDFVEEARHMGVSKRIPLGFDLSKLDPDRSGLLLIHPRAIPLFDYNFIHEDDGKCKLGRDHPKGLCIFHLWHLSSTTSIKKLHYIPDIKNLEALSLRVFTPSTSYWVKRVCHSDGSIMLYPQSRMPAYQPGFILYFPRIHFEYVNSKGEVPKEIERKLDESGFPWKVVKE